uniref:Protein preY, mitochondrial n=1 Tax=Urocitellus parryii TaxID=9999 RepID=A0A8D2H4F3_UROPR
MLSKGILNYLLASTLWRTRAPPSAVTRRCLRATRSLSLADRSERAKEPSSNFDQALLEFLVCPLSKKPLRYEASTNELINEELGIAEHLTHLCHKAACRPRDPIRFGL